MAKSDIESAFRLIPLRKSEYNLTGFYWHGYYIDKCLQMGSSSSCFIFERFSNALQYILREKCQIVNNVKVIDDFLIFGQNELQCLKNLQKFIETMLELGVPLSKPKTFRPSTRMEFLGIVLDTQAMTAHVPENKIAEYSKEVEKYLGADTITLKGLQSLLGKLNHTIQVINVGRPFLRRLYDLLIGHTKPLATIKLTSGAKDDLELWYKFLHSNNLKPIKIEGNTLDSRKINIGSDSSHKGFGATFGSRWIKGTFPPHWLHFSIALLELYPIYIIISMFKEELINAELISVCDNLSVVHIINGQTSKCKKIMKILRPLVLTMLENNIVFKAIHIETKKNILPDAISRQEETAELLEEFGMRPKPEKIPRRLLPENFKEL